MKRVLGEEHPDIAVIYHNLAVVYKRQGELGKVEELYEKSLGIIERTFGDEHPDTAMGYNNLAGVYFSQKKYELALFYSIKAYKIFINKLGFGHPNTKIFRANMEMIYTEWNPEGNFKHCLEERMKETGHN